MRAKEGELLFGLHTLGDNGQAKHAGELHDQGGDGRLLRVTRDLAHEADVDLERVDREEPQARETRVPGAAVVERDMSWRLDTFTATRITPSPARSHSAIWRQTASRIQFPTGMMRPVSSRMPMNAAGATVPTPGRSHRRSASVPAHAPVVTRIFGW